MPVTTRSHSIHEEEDHLGQNYSDSNMAAKKPLTLDDIMSEIKKHATNADARFTLLESKMDKNHDMLNNYMKSNDEALAKVMTTTKGLDNRIKVAEDTVKSLETRVTHLADNVETLSKLNRSQKYVIDKLEDKDKRQEMDKKKQNVIVEGLKEVDRENPRQAAVSLITEIGVNKADEMVVTAFRLGVKKPTQTRPRPLLVKLQSQSSKHEIYKSVKNLRGADQAGKDQKVYIKDDLPADIARQRQDLRCLAALGKDLGYDTTVRGNGLIVDNKRYTYGELGNLPADLSMEKAKTIEVDDGIAFQSEHSFLSSMYPCKIRHDGHALNSAEQVYWYDITKLAGDQQLKDLVRDVKNGYDAKRICSRLRLTDTQRLQREPIMKMAQDKKFH